MCRRRWWCARAAADRVGLQWRGSLHLPPTARVGPSELYLLAHSKSTLRGAAHAVLCAQRDAPPSCRPQAQSRYWQAAWQTACRRSTGGACMGWQRPARIRPPARLPASLLRRHCSACTQVTSAHCLPLCPGVPTACWRWRCLSCACPLRVRPCMPSSSPLILSTVLRCYLLAWA